MMIRDRNLSQSILERRTDRGQHSSLFFVFLVKEEPGSRQIEGARLIDSSEIET